MCSSAQCPGSECSAIGLPARADLLAGCCLLSTGPHQRATGQQTQDLHRENEYSDMYYADVLRKHLQYIHFTLYKIRSQTHFLSMGRLYIQRNSSTPLLRGFACISLVPLLPSTWWDRWQGQILTTWWSHHTNKIAHKILTFYNILWLPYLMPLLMVSVGAQLTVSTQSVQWYCLLSRNQPESDKPRTCIPVCPSPSSSSATRSTLRRTPVPPALHAEI